MADPITTQDVSTLVAFAGGAGVAITKFVDYLIVRMSKNPPDNGAFRAYLEGELKKVQKEVKALSAHVLDCEKDRAHLKHEVNRLTRKIEVQKAGG